MNEVNWLQNFVQMNQTVFWIMFVWVIIWKGIALWKAAQKKHRYWFVALLVINTVGILEILYVFIFSEWKKKGQEPEGNTENNEEKPSE